VEVITRKMSPEDRETAAQIFYSAFNSVGEKWDLATARKRIHQYYNPDTCWVATIDSKVIGILTSKIDNVLDHQELYIDVIAVAPKEHKKGVGNKLLGIAENYAKKHNLEGVWLCASTDLPSFNWYLKTGFKETSWKTLYKKL